MGTFQKLMDGAYDRWQEHKGWTKQDFWDDLDRDERVAVMLGNLNYQVQNGGFSQWWCNGYATPANMDFIIRTCGRIGTKSSTVVAGLVAQARDAFGDNTTDDGLDEDEYEELSVTLDPLDTAYYAIDEEFVADVETFLNGGK